MRGYKLKFTFFTHRPAYAPDRKVTAESETYKMVFFLKLFSSAQSGPQNRRLCLPRSESPIVVRWTILPLCLSVSVLKPKLLAYNLITRPTLSQTHRLTDSETHSSFPLSHCPRHFREPSSSLSKTD